MVRHDRAAAPEWRMGMAGDAALVVEFEPRIDPEINRRAVGLARRVGGAGLCGVRDVVPSYHAVTVYFDPIRVDFQALEAAIRAWAALPADRQDEECEIEVGVRYGGAAGPDLAAVAAFAKCSVEEAVRRHTASSYRVYMLGFLPGFPYLGVVDPSLAMPRRSTPRLAVPARSVGIAGLQTGIYPTTAPGGWQLIGQAEIEPFQAWREPPCAFRPGDTVRFHAVSVEAGR
jgi:KipI family sensor histidine kinase inhibitor